MDWFLTAATGRDARRDALLGQRLTDVVAAIFLIPHHRGHRWQVIVYPISTSGSGASDGSPCPGLAPLHKT